MLDKFNALQTHSLTFADGIDLTELFTMQGREMGRSQVGMMGAAADKSPALMLKSRQTDKLYFAFPALARPVCSSGGITVC